MSYKNGILSHELIKRGETLKVPFQHYQIILGPGPIGEIFRNEVIK